MMTETNDSDSGYEAEPESALSTFGNTNISGAYNELVSQVAVKEECFSTYERDTRGLFEEIGELTIKRKGLGENEETQNVI